MDYLIARNYEGCEPIRYQEGTLEHLMRYIRAEDFDVSAIRPDAFRVRYPGTVMDFLELIGGKVPAGLRITAHDPPRDRVAEANGPSEQGNTFSWDE